MVVTIGGHALADTATHSLTPHAFPLSPIFVFFATLVVVIVDVY